MEEIELLAPAGSYESLVAAVNAGADAVYIGGSRFSARAYADNPQEDQLLKGIAYAHLFGVHLYLALNILCKEGEMGELYDYLLPYYEAGIDAVIVQDLGVFDYLRRVFPDLPIHASTQMTITGPLGASFLKSRGACRVVPARELGLEEIARIRDMGGMEIECFVHGALCYAYSGQCLMSSLIGGRSGNRGRCAQTCRLPYDVFGGPQGERKMNRQGETLLLSCKDLCSLDLLPDIIEAGVVSLKIEGRMKSPLYTAGVVRIWRKYLDLYLQKGKKGYAVDPKDRGLLLDLFDRGGQTAGYYKKHNGRDMVLLREKTGFKAANEAFFAQLKKDYLLERGGLAIEGKFRAVQGETIALSIRRAGIPRLYRRKVNPSAFPQVQFYGDMAQASQNRPADMASVKEKLEKTGNTPFVFSDLEVELGEGVFLPVKALNTLRREGLLQLEKAILSLYQRKAPEKAVPAFAKGEEKGKWIPRFNFLCETREQLKAVLSFLQEEPNTPCEITLDCGMAEPKAFPMLLAPIRERKKKALLFMPHIFREEARVYFTRYQREFLAAGFDAFLIRSLEEKFFLEEMLQGKGELYLDYTLYQTNTLAGDFYKRELGAKRTTLSPELNIKELEEAGARGAEVIVYGHLPMMVSAQCLKKTLKGCDHLEETLVLRDRMKQRMPVKTRCRFCYNTILNATPLSVLGMEKEIKALAPGSLRLWFTVEDFQTTRECIREYVRAFWGEGGKNPKGSFTRGHMKRGVL